MTIVQFDWRGGSPRGRGLVARYPPGAAPIPT
jgi:hypothetical protein